MVLFFNLIKTPTCEFNLFTVLSLSLQGRTRVNCASRTSQNDLKTSPSSNCIGVSAEFSKFAGKRFKTVMLRLGEVIIGVIISAQKS